MYLVYGLWSDHNSDIGTMFLTIVLIHGYWKNKIGKKATEPFFNILNSVTYFTSSLSNIDGVKWESAALGISSSSSLSEMFLKKNGEQHSRTYKKLRKFTSWASDIMI